MKNTAFFSDNMSAARKIAVPVLVKDGKPCGDASPLSVDDLSSSGGVSTPPSPKQQASSVPNHHLSNQQNMAAANFRLQLGQLSQYQQPQPASQSQAASWAAFHHHQFGQGTFGAGPFGAANPAAAYHQAASSAYYPLQAPWWLNVIIKQNDETIELLLGIKLA